MSGADDLFRAARRHHVEGHLDAAETACRRILETAPNHADALHMLGVVASQRGDTEAALTLFERAAMQRPEDPRILNNLGTAYRAVGRLDEAEASYRRALDRDAGSFRARVNLANVLTARGDLDPALDEYRLALSERPRDPGTLNNYAAALRLAGRIGEAEDVYRGLVGERPDDATAHNNLGVVCMNSARPEAAAACYRRALEIDPGHLEALNNLGVAYLELGAFDDALACLDDCIARDASVAEAHENRGNVLGKIGDDTGARAAYENALALQPKGGVRIKAATVLPVIARNRAALTEARGRMALAVDALMAAPPVLGDPYAEVGMTNFNLSYHDACNRDVQAKMARLYLSACPDLAEAAPHCTTRAPRGGRRLKLGFISRQFATNAVGWCFHGVIRFMPRGHFSVTAFRFGESDDPVWRRIAADADAAVVLPLDLAAARRRIAEEAPDVLVYTDIGMEPLTYYLAFARLAPLQAALGGHPDTTGIPNIDLFISSDAQEPADTRAHYSEALIRLPGAPTYYQRPDPPDPLKPRSAFGLPEAAALYFCAQTLIKIHPGMDALFRDILRADPDGLLLLPTGYNPRLATLLRRRFESSLGDLVARVRFLPTMSHLDFMNVMALADVSLDTRPFGGGNTSWQAVAAGTPIVTWPGRFLRGRYTLALYELMGVTDTVVDTADGYAAMAVRLGRDTDFKADVRARLAAAGDRVFADMTHVTALHDVLLEWARRQV